MNTCTNKGCRQSFKWPTQLARHMKNCNFPPVEVQKDYFKNSDDLFECRKCSKTFKYQSNVSRHKNDCKGQNVSVNKCTQCDKEFKYQSRLNKHLRFMKRISVRCVVIVALVLEEQTIFKSTLSTVEKVTKCVILIMITSKKVKIMIMQILTIPYQHFYQPNNYIPPTITSTIKILVSLLQ